MKNEIIEKLKSLGLDNQKAEELFQVISEEIYDDLFERLVEQANEQELDSIKGRINNAKSQEHTQVIFDEIALTVYGDDAEEIIRKMYLDTVNSIKQSIEEANDLIQKANSGDPEAIELIEQAKDSETYKNITSENN